MLKKPIRATIRKKKSGSIVYPEMKERMYSGSEWEFPELHSENLEKENNPLLKGYGPKKSISNSLQKKRNKSPNLMICYSEIENDFKTHRIIFKIFLTNFSNQLDQDVHPYEKNNRNIWKQELLLYLYKHFLF